MLSLEGLRLTKFVSNVPDLAEKLNPENSKIDTVEEINLTHTAMHVLGLRLDNKNDTLNVSRGVNKITTKLITQRSVFCCVSTVFDSIGLVAPYTGRARLLLKDVWCLSRQQWDESLSGEFQEKFIEWHTSLPNTWTTKNFWLFLRHPG